MTSCPIFHGLLTSDFGFGFEGRMWDLIISVPDHCLSFYFDQFCKVNIFIIGRFLSSVDGSKLIFY